MMDAQCNHDWEYHAWKGFVMFMDALRCKKCGVYYDIMAREFFTPAGRSALGDG